MKPTKNIEEFVKLEKPNVTTGERMDKRTIDASFAAMDETIRSGKRSAAGIILRSRAAKLAAAAVILVAVGLLMVYRNPPAQKPPQPVSVAKSPIEILTVASLNIAYRKGGLKAVEAQFEKALNKQKPQPTTISAQELLEDFNG